MANSSTPNPNAPDNGSRATYTENLPRRLRSSGPIAGSSSSTTAGSSSSTTAGSSSSLTAGSTSSTTAGSTSSIFLRQRLQATPLNSDATKPLKMALNVRGILALRSNSTTTSKAQDTPSSRSVRFVPLPAHYGKCSRNSAYIWRGATQDNSLTQKSSDVRNHSARADRGNNSRSSSSTLARSIQTFHAFKPRNKLADTDEIESPLLG
ncbi:hypothetical protein D6C93_01277 [Aureobasidium pullulans]|nr:hypothetical protein D6C93_01277 [Aureobasidium pullulans]